MQATFLSGHDSLMISSVSRICHRDTADRHADNIANQSIGREVFPMIFPGGEGFLPPTGTRFLRPN